MPRKSPKAPPKKPDPRYVDPDGAVRLPAEQYWHWRALTSDLERFSAAHRHGVAELEAFEARTPELRDIRARIAAARGDNAATAKELLALQQEIADATGLNLQECAVDDRTGHIHPLPAPEAPNSAT